MKNAQSVAEKFVNRAGAATEDYKKGVAETTKSQSGRAIAAESIYQSQLQASFSRKAFSKGLSKSGDAGWKAGVAEKGGDRFGPGVAGSAQKYATNSGKFDAARASADSMPRGAKGSPSNLARVAKVVSELRSVKLAQ